MERCVHVVARLDTSRRYVVNELELEVQQGYSQGEIETVSIDSVHLNKNQSLLTAS